MFAYLPLKHDQSPLGLNCWFKVERQSHTSEERFKIMYLGSKYFFNFCYDIIDKQVGLAVILLNNYNEMALAKYSNFLSNVESVTRCTKELFSDSNLHFLSKTFQQCSILSSLMLLSLMGTSMKSLEADDDEDELDVVDRLSSSPSSSSSV